MSLNDIRIADWSDMPVRHPTTGAALTTSDGRPMTIRLTGQDSPQYRQAMAQLQALISKRRGNRLSPGDMEEHVLRTLTACTLGWVLELDAEDGDLAFSQDAALDLYRKLRWLREQADEWVNDRSNFLGESLPA